MPDGAWRGEVVAVGSRGVSVKLPRFDTTKVFGPIEGEPGVTYAKGDRVLCMFFEGRNDKLEILRKTAMPIDEGAPSYPGFFGPIFGGSF